eukprot:EG_transcript_925
MAPRPSLALLLWLLLAACSTAQDFVIGMSGPLMTDGNILADGIRYAFWEANAAGGIAGRNVSLLALNDGYIAANAVANVQRLLDQDNVLALAGLVGTGIVAAVAPIIVNRSAAVVGMYTGAAEFHTPFVENLINVRASFSDEMVALAIFMVGVGGLQRIACLYQGDAFGLAGLKALSDALANVGMALVAAANYTLRTTDVTHAIESIAGAPGQAQAVVLIATVGATINFIRGYSADPRANPNCLFGAISSVWSPNITAQLEPKFWPRLYFTNVVPVPDDPSWMIARKFSAGYSAWGKVPEPIAFEGYVNGRLVVEVLRLLNRPDVTRKMFLDTIYNTRLFVLDDLLVGMYSRNYPGCAAALCACNAGIRDVFLSQLDVSTGKLAPFGSKRYATTQCAYPVSSVVMPMLFGQLVPTWDAGWSRVALEMGRGMRQAFAEANAAGGYGGRSFYLVQQNYSADAAEAIQALSDRYPLLGSLGSVVRSTADLQFIQPTIPTVGTFDIVPDATTAGYVRRDMRVQPSTALELMALAKFAVAAGGPIHLRAPATADGQAMLDVMVKSVRTFQKKPSSASLFSDATTVLSETQTGCVIALGTEADVAAWFTGLVAYPALQLLTLSGSAMQLMATVDVASAPQGPRLHFPTLMTGSWNRTTTGPEPSEPWKYGYVTATAAILTMRGSEYAAYSYTTPTQFVRAWYLVKLMTSGSVNLGPYYGDACTPGKTDCQCNLGGNSLAVRNGASSAAELLYSITTCRVAYLPFNDSSDVLVPATVGGVVGGFFCLLLVTGAVVLRMKRNNSAAPKNSNKPFCVLFTDIQSSTHLWATVPDIMAPALDTHHALIRRLIAKHQCYEVKTIGDSFMCAAHTPQQAVRLALAIQTALHQHDWGTDAISDVYANAVLTDTVAKAAHTCWNGLRVRVGIHYGRGDIRFDSVSKGYDYYGTVVNTAARIESACHGGQIGVSQAVYDALGGDLPGSVWSDLGRHELRGLSEPIRLYQILPDGPYSQRTFPPLRLEKEDQIHEALQASEEVVVVTQRSGSTKGGGGDVGNRGSLSTVAENWKWVEMHPLVVRGDITAEILRKHYLVALTTLSTLLNTQTAKFKETVVQGLCERLHVPNHGVAGVQLQHTLKGLVQRVLPATVLAVQGCGNSTNNFSCDRLSSCLVTGIDANSLGGSFRAIRVQGAPVLNAESP